MTFPAGTITVDGFDDAIVGFVDGSVQGRAEPTRSHGAWSDQPHLTGDDVTDILHFDIRQLTVLLEWFDGQPAYADFCAKIRARIEQLRSMN